MPIPFHGSLRVCVFALPSAATDEFTYIYDSYAGPWCFCKDPIPSVEKSAQYCAPALETPEQINLQYAAPGVIVVGFVTYEVTNPEKPPQAILSQVDSATNVTILGITHRYAPPGRNGTVVPGIDGLNNLPYMMHYVILNVTPGHIYNYRVRSGSNSARWSEIFTFKAPGGSNTTRIAT